MYIIRYEYYSEKEKRFVTEEVATGIKIPMIAIGGIAFFTDRVIANFSYRRVAPELNLGMKRLNDAMILKAFKEQLSFFDD